MKTKIFILTFVVMLLSVSSYATKLPTIEVIPLSSKKTLVTFFNEEPKQLNITIKDERGVVLFQNKSKDCTNDYRKIFNFSELEDGIYTLCLHYDNCNIYHDLAISRSNVAVRNEVRVYDPWYSVVDNKVLFTFLNPALENVYLKVYQDGENILKQKLGNKMAINKRFDISNLNKGNYEFVVSDVYKDYAFTINR